MSFTCVRCGKTAKADPGGQFVSTDEGETYCTVCALSQFATPEEKRAKREAESQENREKAFRGMATERKVSQSLGALKEDIGWRLWKYATPAHFCRQCIADYNGYTFGGAVLGLEVKSTKDKRWSLAVMPEHQVKYLDDLDACAERCGHGGGAFVLVEFTSAQRWFLFPWSVIRSQRIAHPTDGWVRPFEASPLAWWKPLDGGVFKWA